MIYVVVGVTYLVTIVGFVWALYSQAQAFIDAAADTEARNMAERNSLLSRIQRPDVEPVPPNVVPLRPVVGEPPEPESVYEDDLYLVGTINASDGNMNDNDTAA